jgi:hypothetical protein
MRSSKSTPGLGFSGTMMRSGSMRGSFAAGGLGMSSSSRGGGGGSSMQWTDPSRLASFFDQDWARASYGRAAGLQASVGPYASLDLDRPRSRLEASVALDVTSQMSQGGVTQGGASGSVGGGNLLSESGRDLTATYAPLSSMAGHTMTIPSLPDTKADAVSSIPQTDEQVGSNAAARTLRLARSNGDLKTQAVFRDSKFMFGFCTRQTAEIITPRSVPKPTDKLGRLSTCEERRNELFLNKKIKQAETLIRKAEGQKSRRTMLMEKKHKYLLEGDTFGDFKPSKDFIVAKERRLQHSQRVARARYVRMKKLSAVENTQARRGFDFIRDFRSEGQAPLQASERKLTQTLGRVGGKGHEDTWERLYVRDEKKKNNARSQHLYNRNVGNKPHNIITGAALLIQPTEPPPKPRRDVHPSIVIHGMAQFGAK